MPHVFSRPHHQRIYAFSIEIPNYNVVTASAQSRQLFNDEKNRLFFCLEYGGYFPISIWAINLDLHISPERIELETWDWSHFLEIFE